jgi:hypothetical protein
LTILGAASLLSTALAVTIPPHPSPSTIDTTVALFHHWFRKPGVAVILCHLFVSQFCTSVEAERYNCANSGINLCAYGIVLHFLLAEARGAIAAGDGDGQWQCSVGLAGTTRDPILVLTLRCRM